MVQIFFRRRSRDQLRSQPKFTMAWSKVRVRFAVRPGINDLAAFPNRLNIWLRHLRFRITIIITITIIWVCHVATTRRIRNWVRWKNVWRKERHPLVRNSGCTEKLTLFFVFFLSNLTRSCICVECISNRNTRNRNSPVINSTNLHWQYGSSAGGNSSTHHNQVWIFILIESLVFTEGENRVEKTSRCGWEDFEISIRLKE